MLVRKRKYKSVNISGGKMTEQIKTMFLERGIPTTYAERCKLNAVLYSDDLKNARRINPLSFMIQEIDVIKELCYQTNELKLALECMKEQGKLLRYSQQNPLLDALDNGELTPDDVANFLDNWKAKQEVKQIAQKKQSKNG